MVAVISLLVSTALFAEGFSFGGFWKSDSQRAGGAIELGLPSFYEKDGFAIRGHIEAEGAAYIQETTPSGTGMLTAKLLFSTTYENNGFIVKSYGFGYTGAGLVFAEPLAGTKSSAATTWDFGGGGGFELGLGTVTEPYAAFVIEYGGGWCRAKQTKSFGYNFLTLGWRQYY